MIKFLIDGIRAALHFSKSEARGTLILIAIILLTFSSSKIYEAWLMNKAPSPSTNHDELKAWVKEVEDSYKLKKDEKKPNFPKKTYKSTYKESEKTYENPTVIDETDHSEPYESKKKKIAAPIIKKDLNKANAEELQKVRGIGPAFSKRIIKFRSALGGFYDLRQLNEVYGLKPETIEEIVKHFEITSEVEKFNINSDSAKVLASHPYISYDLAWVMINYRKVHGDFESGEELKKVKALDDSTFIKLKPYLH